MRIVATMMAIALVSAASIVLAGDKVHGAHMRAAAVERMKAADTNGDGLISRAEAGTLPRLAKRFDRIDANQDGQLGADELLAFHEARRAQRERRRDERCEAKK